MNRARRNQRRSEDIGDTHTQDRSIMQRLIGFAIIIVVSAFSGNLARADSAAAEKADGSPFAVERSEEGILVTERGKPAFFYQQQPKSQNGRFTRANYIHPLYDLAGDVLTEDFPADHPHHRGVYWAWHQLRVGDRDAGDSWAAQDILSDVRSVDVTEKNARSLALAIHAVWKSPHVIGPNGERLPIVDEHTTIRVHRSRHELRIIDFEISLRALLPDVSIGGSDDDKGYGGFSVRMKLPRDVRFTGTRGKVVPKRTSVDAGPWVDVAASEKSQVGIAILQHPTNPGHPQPWILRAAKSMQNPAWPGREAVALPRDEPLTLRYRLVIHEDRLPAATLDALQAEYARSGARPAN